MVTKEEVREVLREVVGNDGSNGEAPTGVFGKISDLEKVIGKPDSATNLYFGIDQLLSQQYSQLTRNIGDVELAIQTDIDEIKKTLKTLDEVNKTLGKTITGTVVDKIASINHSVGGEAVGTEPLVQKIHEISENVSGIKTNQILRTDVIRESELKSWFQGHTHT